MLRFTTFPVSVLMCNTCCTLSTNQCLDDDSVVLSPSIVVCGGGAVEFPLNISDDDSSIACVF